MRGAMPERTAATYAVKLPGGVTERGFWLYVWRVRAPGGEELLYVGRTGDNTSAHAQSPYARMGQHLASNSNRKPVRGTAQLRRHVERRGIRVEECDYELLAHGPLFAETGDWSLHVRRRNAVAALESALAQGLQHVGFDVLNERVRSATSRDEDLWQDVRRAFAEHFPELGRLTWPW